MLKIRQDEFGLFNVVREIAEEKYEVVDGPYAFEENAEASREYINARR